MPLLEGFMTVPLAVEVRFHKWNEILKAPQPHPDMHTATVFWHFARGLALRHRKTEEAEAEQKFVAEAKRRRRRMQSSRCPSTTRQDILKIAENVLARKSHSRKTIWTPR